MNKKRKSLIIILCVMLSSSLFTSFTKTQQVSAHQGYKINYLFDPSVGRYMSQVALEGNTNKNGSKTKPDSSHGDLKIGWNSLENKNLFGDSAPLINNSSEIVDTYAKVMGVEGADNFYENNKDKIDTGDGGQVWKPLMNGDSALSGDSNHEEYWQVLPSTFPAYNQQGFKILVGPSNDASGEDRERATLVGTTLVNSLNDALNFIGQTTQMNFGGEPNLTLEWAEWLAWYSALSVNSDPGKKEKEITNFTVSIEKAKNDNSEGYNKFIKTKPAYLELNDYVKITISPKNNPQMEPISSYYPQSIYKGYNKNKYGNQKPMEDSKAYEKTFDEVIITWRHVITEAHINYKIYQITAANAGDLVKSNNSIESFIYRFLETSLSQIKNFLGLYTPAELIFGLGQRGNFYYNNVMPLSWFQRANAVFAVSMILAWIALFTSLIQLSFKKNLSAISNSESRVDMIEGYRNVIITGILLFMAIPFFYIASLIAHNATLMFKSISPCSVNFGELKFFQTGDMGYIVATIALLLFYIYLNFVYIYRAILATMLYAISPLCIATLAMSSQRNSGAFTNWLKSLISVLTLPVLHAAIIAIIAPIFCNEYSRTIEVLCVMYAFIPITKKLGELFNIDPFDDKMGTAAMGAAAITGAAALRGLKGSFSKGYADSSAPPKDKEGDGGKNKDKDNQGNIKKADANKFEQNYKNNEVAADKDSSNPGAGDGTISGKSGNGGKDSGAGGKDSGVGGKDSGVGGKDSGGGNESTLGDANYVPQDIKDKERSEKTEKMIKGAKFGMSNAAKMALGAAQVAVGAGITMGGEAMGVHGLGNGIMNSGANRVASGGGAFAGKAMGMAKTGFSNVKNSAIDSYKAHKEASNTPKISTTTSTAENTHNAKEGNPNVDKIITNNGSEGKNTSDVKDEITVGNANDNDNTNTNTNTKGNGNGKKKTEDAIDLDDIEPKEVNTNGNTEQELMEQKRKQLNFDDEVMIGRADD